MSAYFRVGFLSLVFLAVIPSGACYSEVSTSPVGVWKTFDDGKARGFVRIYEAGRKVVRPDRTIVHSRRRTSALRRSAPMTQESSPS